jgi:hypothetical protein
MRIQPSLVALVPFFVSPVTRAIAYSLRRQNIRFRSRRKLEACLLSVPTPEKHVLRRHEPGYGNLVLWYLSTQDSAQCMNVNDTFYSHAYSVFLQFGAARASVLYRSDWL